ncbi:MAG: hypothetical protein QM589_10720 [Thermomicrobiales bacterium]
MNASDHHSAATLDRVLPPALTRPIQPPQLFADRQHRTTFARMMQQQFWLWGCDVRRQEGNLLALHGFEKQRPPEESGCSTSRYTRRVAQDIDLVLWGFGLLASREGDGSVFLSRHALRPRCGDCGASLDVRWDPDDFRDLRRPASACDHRRVRLLLADVLAWIADYERSVLDTAGISFRSSSIAAWKRAVGPAQELPARWNELATSLHTEGWAIALP